MFKSQRSAAIPFLAAAATVTAVMIALLLSYGIHAQNAPDSVTIAVSPQSLDTTVNPGQSVTNVFRITNGGDQSVQIEPTPKNFVPRGNEGAIAIEEEDTPYSLAQWLSVSPKGPVSIEAKATVDFKVTISVPDNADPGGHFGSVVFRTLPSDQPGSAASISQEVVPVILVRVPGDAKEEATISSFTVPDSPVTTANKAITFETIVKNNGNVHLRPTGTVSVFNMFGKQVSSTQIQSNNVIPGAERKMNASWESPGFRLGWYTARLTMVYGTENQIMTAQTSFVVFPVKQVLPVIVITAIVLFLLFRIRHRLLLAAKIVAGKQEGK